MSLKSKINNLNYRAKRIKDRARILNMECSELNGVAATIPNNVPAPAVYFKGSKVILHNVIFDYEAGEISATITLPFNRDSETKEFSITKHRFHINDTWLK